MNEPTEQSFLHDVEQHQMTVIRDDGINRHIRFSRPGTGCMHFDLVTWPGYLCYTGDMGTYVFTRLHDMFQFFRTDRESRHLKAGQTLAINPHYWSEKLVAVDGQRSGGAAEEFDPAVFDRVIFHRTIEWMRENRHRTTKEQRRELWEVVIDEVINADSDSGGFRKQCAAHDFYHTVDRDRDLAFYFQDLFEHRFTRYTFRFIWCCYALAWGIQQYDKAREAVAV